MRDDQNRILRCRHGITRKIKFFEFTDGNIRKTRRIVFKRSIAILIYLVINGLIHIDEI
ncbi:hypothetical protein SAMN05428952_101364 [Nitrosomonas sp. Nm132]|nr:hypothetical protein SAMN05428952_101364 [Nitrosomonas sp. Nm132]